jgi:hypothetical protein
MQRHIFDERKKVVIKESERLQIFEGVLTLILHLV